MAERAIARPWDQRSIQAWRDQQIEPGRWPEGNLGRWHVILNTDEDRRNHLLWLAASHINSYRQMNGDAGEMLVAADLCEEHGFHKAASILRGASGNFVRASEPIEPSEIEWITDQVDNGE